MDTVVMTLFGRWRVTMGELIICMFLSLMGAGCLSTAYLGTKLGTIAKNESVAPKAISEALESHDGRASKDYEDLKAQIMAEHVTEKLIETQLATYLRSQHIKFDVAPITGNQ